MIRNAYGDHLSDDDLFQGWPLWLMIEMLYIQYESSKSLNFTLMRAIDYKCHSLNSFPVGYALDRRVQVDVGLLHYMQTLVNSKCPIPYQLILTAFDFIKERNNESR